MYSSYSGFAHITIYMRHSQLKKYFPVSVSFTDIGVKRLRRDERYRYHETNASLFVCSDLVFAKSFTLCLTAKHFHRYMLCPEIIL